LGLGRFTSESFTWMPDSRRLVVSKSLPATTIYAVDATRGRVRTMYKSPNLMSEPAVSPDGKRMAYRAGDYEWNVLEIFLADRSVRPVVAGSGAAWWPDWAPSGTHFLYSTDREGPFAIVDRFAKEGLTRQLAEAPSGTVTDDPHWAPDGKRFLFFSATPAEGAKLMLSNASGGRTTTLDTDVTLGAAAWSPDGQWVAYGRMKAGKIEMAKVQPGSEGSPIILFSVGLPQGFGSRGYARIQWSPSGDWILYPTLSESKGLSLISPDGHMTRELTPRPFYTYGFSKDGSQVLGIYRNTNPAGAEWEMYSVDVKSGAERLLGAVDLPPATEGIAGFSLHPDGKSFLISIAKWPYDIWMLEGFDPKKNWLDRLLRR
jgi:Tol biopolymer transport system component